MKLITESVSMKNKRSIYIKSISFCITYFPSKEWWQKVTFFLLNPKNLLTKRIVDRKMYFLNMKYFTRALKMKETHIGKKKKKCCSASLTGRLLRILSCCHVWPHSCLFIKVVLCLAFRFKASLISQLQTNSNLGRPQFSQHVQGLRVNVSSGSEPDAARIFMDIVVSFLRLISYENKL